MSTLHESCVCAGSVAFNYTKGTCFNYTKWILQPAAFLANTSWACFHVITNSLLLSEQRCPFVWVGDGGLSQSPCCMYVVARFSLRPQRAQPPHYNLSHWEGRRRRVPSGFG